MMLSEDLHQDYLREDVEILVQIYNSLNIIETSTDNAIIYTHQTSKHWNFNK